MNDPEVAELVIASRNGDRRAFDRLVEKYSRYAFYNALSIVRDYEAAEDIVQDSFIQVFRMLNGLREPSKFESWLTSIVRNRSLSSLRRNKRRPDNALGVEIQAVADPSIEDPVEEERLRHERAFLLSRIKTLPEIQRRLLLLKYVERMSVEDIALKENLTEAAVRNHLYRARNIMRRMLQDERKRT